MTPFRHEPFTPDASFVPRKIWREMPLRRLHKGDTLFWSATGQRGIWQLEKGYVTVSLEFECGKERILELAGAGDIIGTVSDGCGRTVESAVSLSETFARELPPSDDADSVFRRLTATRMLQLENVLAQVDHPVQARLARTLLGLAMRFGREAGPDQLLLEAPITHEHIANMIGAARETTSATLSLFREAGWLEGSRGRYRLHRPAMERIGKWSP